MHEIKSATNAEYHGFADVMSVKFKHIFDASRFTVYASLMGIIFDDDFRSRKFVFTHCSYFLLSINLIGFRLDSGI